jgi:hypothetical protein
MTSLEQAANNTFEIDGERYRYYSIPAVARLPGLAGLARLPRTLHVHRVSGATDQFEVVMRIDTTEEIACYTHGRKLPMVYREFLQARAARA